MKTDIIIVGSGVAGLFCALNLPKEKNVLVLTKSNAQDSDSYLAQGGICVLRDENDYDDYFEDTMKAGHYLNDKESVDIMISSSREIIDDLIRFGTEFESRNGELIYTKEGAHSRARILYHKDQTGKEITSTLLTRAYEKENIEILENHTVVDIIEVDGECRGVICKNEFGECFEIYADYTVLATGGIGGLFDHSTNFPHLTGDALAISLEHNIRLKDIDYIQIHPTTLYTKKKGRAFLISESVRGEGAILLDKNGKRFVNELLPRDKVANAIYEQMKIDGTEHVWLSLEKIPKDEILSHFPNIYNKCLEEGYDVTREPVPVVPSQHYFMGGVDVNKVSMTSMARLYAVGETSCNGVHGKNRLASNSLLESLVFAKRAAKDIERNYSESAVTEITLNEEKYENCQSRYKERVLSEIEKERKRRERNNT